MPTEANSNASSPSGISVMIFTLNEALHLPACLASLSWCDDVIVIDSLSSDETEQIARASGARFFSNPFAGFGAQRNWALDHANPKHRWVLILDADERVTPELAKEMLEIEFLLSTELGRSPLVHLLLRSFV